MWEIVSEQPQREGELEGKMRATMTSTLLTQSLSSVLNLKDSEFIVIKGCGTPFPCDTRSKKLLTRHAMGLQVAVTLTDALSNWPKPPAARGQGEEK